MKKVIVMAIALMGSSMLLTACGEDPMQEVNDEVARNQMTPQEAALRNAENQAIKEAYINN